jgi:hypothetical protein
MGLHKITKIVMAIFAILGAIVVGIIFGIDEEAMQTEMKLNGVETIDAPAIDNIMLLSWIILAIIVVIVLIYVVKGLFSGNAKKTLIGVGAFALVIAIAYFTASGVETPLKDDGEVLSANGAKWVEAGIHAFYMLAVIAVGLMVASGVKKLVK